jgi:enoyl-CoA hydratase
MASPRYEDTPVTVEVPPARASVDLVTVRDQGRIRLVTLDDPASRNALSRRMLQSVVDALGTAAREGVPAVVLSGARGTFASGADLRELDGATPGTYLAQRRAELWDQIAEFPHLIIAAVQGYALGGGCELALTCDAIVAGDRTIFGQPEVRIGAVPGAGGSQRWPRAAGRFHAAPLVLGGVRIDAREAPRMGVIDRVVPELRVVAAAVDLANELIDGVSLHAQRHAKQLLRLSEQATLSDGLASERQAFASLIDTPDLHEGIAAVLQKRPAHFPTTKSGAS